MDFYFYWTGGYSGGSNTYLPPSTSYGPPSYSSHSSRVVGKWIAKDKKQKNSTHTKSERERKNEEKK